MDTKKRRKIVELLSELIASLSEQEKKEILSGILETKEGFPISIFRSQLSGLEAMVVFLKDNGQKNVSQIALLLNRKKSTIYTTYTKAKQKIRKPLDVSDTTIVLPFDKFKNRKFSVLETIVAYLKLKHQLPFVKISAILNKNYNTIRTVYVRHELKCQR
ncbi:MAG: hypothetical protein AABX05_01020 [Nanoarchaeota archaeon]